MRSENFIKSIKEEAFLVAQGGVIIEVNELFIKLTGYTCDELLNKNIAAEFRTMGIGSDIDIEDINERTDYFFFTKSLDVIFVNIKVICEKDKKIFIFLEKPDSRLEFKFPFLNALFHDNYYGIGIYSVPDITLLKANEKYIGYKDAQFNSKECCVGKHISRFVTGFKGSEYEEIWNTVLKTKEVYNIDEFKYEGFIRGITYWKLSLIPICEEDKFKYCIVMTTEITEQILNRREAEKQAEIIVQQNKKLEAIIQNVSDEMFLINKDASVTLLNNNSKNNIYNMMEYKKDDIYKRTEYFDKDGKPITLTELPGMKALRGEKIKNYFFTVKQLNKTFHYNLSASPIYDDKDKIASAVICAHDITEFINSEKKVVEQKEQLQAILDNIQDFIYVFDRDYKGFIMNKVAEERFKTIYGGMYENFKNTKFFDLTGKEIMVEEMPNYRVKRGEFIQDYFMYFKTQGSEEYLSISGAPVFDQEGKFVYGIICSRIVTDFMKSEKVLKETKDKLLKAEYEKNESLEKALEMKDEFLSLISHEFRTPLNVVNTAIQAIDHLCSNELSDRVKKYLGMIKLNTFRQLRLVNNLLDITRADAGRIKINKKNIDMVFLTKAITESVHAYASQKGINITFISSIDKKIIAIDDEKYERILLNLLSNAIKFTPEGKLIKVTLSLKPGKVCIEVKDNGIGIPQDKAEVIFERFGQVDSALSRRAEGTGIGLSLVKKFVEALGGSISLKSKVGKGSAFKILLPDIMIPEQDMKKELIEFSGNRLVQTIHVEFSDIYL